jgi:RHS repeat-associated protein
VPVAASGTTFASSATYLPFGPLTGFTYGNGLKRAMSFDTPYGITENKLFNPPTNIARYSYSYDAAGNILGIQDAVDGTYSRTFAYDDLNRLTTANTGTSLWGTGSYAYDAMGNLTSRSLGTPPPPDPGGLSIPGRHVRSTTTVTGQVDRLSFTFVGTTPKISVVTANGLDHTVSYDNAGNETGYYVARTYSPRNLMNLVTDTSGEGPAHSISYGYDYRGVRVSRTESPTDAGSASRYYFYTPELQLLASTVDDSYNVWGQSAHIMSTPLVMNREVIWFNGAPVGEFGPPRTPDTTTELSRHRTFDTNTPANNVFYTFTDHLGTPLIQTDPTTAIVWRAEHEPYGNVYLMRKGSRTDQPLRFPGQEAAMPWEGAEENYNVFRWYRGGWGRYTQADPIALKGGTNLFRYANANPVREIDARGLKCSAQCPECPGGTWAFYGVNGGFLLSLGSLSYGLNVGIFDAVCTSSSKKCTYYVNCEQGFGIGFSININASVGAVFNAPCSDSISGVSFGATTNGYGGAGAAASGSVGSSGSVMVGGSAGLGAGGGSAFQVCQTAKISCN